MTTRNHSPPKSQMYAILKKSIIHFVLTLVSISFVGLISHFDVTHTSQQMCNNLNFSGLNCEFSFYVNFVSRLIILTEQILLLRLNFSINMLFLLYLVREKHNKSIRFTRNIVNLTKFVFRFFAIALVIKYGLL